VTAVPDLVVATEYVERGWCLHPLRPGDKKPLLKNWQHEATCEPRQLDRWAEQYPRCNWGAVTGGRSGIFVVDLDGEAGLDWLKARIDDGFDLPETWTVRTPRGGLHLYFQHKPGIRNSGGRIAEDVDVRGEGGYAVCPPSALDSGRYEIVDPTCPASPAPQWVVAEIERASPSPKSRPKVPGMLREGQRNSGLTRFAGRLRASGHDAESIETSLKAANTQSCLPPLDSLEVARIAMSVSRYTAGNAAGDGLLMAWEAIEEEPCDGYQKFLLLAGVLHRLRNGQPILLPVAKLAPLFGCHQTQVTRWRNRAQRAGVIDLVEPHRPRLAATVFRFNPESLHR